MPRIMLLGRSTLLLNVLANILKVRGSAVCLALDEGRARHILIELLPDLVIWDQAPGDDGLDPAHLGYQGPLLVLAQQAGTYLQAHPLRRVLVKPVGVDELMLAVTELTQ